MGKRSCPAIEERLAKKILGDGARYEGHLSNWAWRFVVTDKKYSGGASAAPPKAKKLGCGQYIREDRFKVREVVYVMHASKVTQMFPNDRRKLELYDCTVACNVGDVPIKIHRQSSRGVVQKRLAPGEKIWTFQSGSDEYQGGLGVELCVAPDIEEGPFGMLHMFSITHHDSNFNSSYFL